MFPDVPVVVAAVVGWWRRLVPPDAGTNEGRFRLFAPAAGIFLFVGALYVANDPACSVVVQFQGIYHDVRPMAAATRSSRGAGWTGGPAARLTAIRTGAPKIPPPRFRRVFRHPDSARVVIRGTFYDAGKRVDNDRPLPLDVRAAGLRFRGTSGKRTHAREMALTAPDRDGRAIPRCHSASRARARANGIGDPAAE